MPKDTLKYCPHCESRGRKVKRHRISFKTGPFTREQCSGFEKRIPRISAKNAWWKRGVISLLLIPDYRRMWYIVRIKAFCGECKHVERVVYARPLGLIRVCLDQTRKHPLSRPFIYWYLRMRRRVYRCSRFKFTWANMIRALKWCFDTTVLLARSSM